MRMLSISLAATALLALGCDKSSASNPATVTRDVLNPPSGLASVTLDGKLQLRWNAANAESDFKGFHVFVYKGKIADLGTPGYPTGLDLSKGAQIPRCSSNSAIFEKIGFQATTADCQGAAEKASTNTSSSSSSSTGSKFELTAADDMMTVADSTATGSGGSAAPTEKLTNISVCAENTTDATISLVGTVPTLTAQVCTVTKDSAGNALANGVTYTVFVAAVMGDGNNKLSWTSNFIQDTPAASLYDKTLTVKTNNYYTIPASSLTPTTSGKAPAAITTDPTAATCDSVSDAVCGINRLNDQKTAGVYIGRAGSTYVNSAGATVTNGYRQRAFLSVPTGSGIAVQLRGPQLWDGGKFAKSIPNDKAASTGYDTAGTLYPLYGYEVFDLQITSGTNKYYGKIVVGKVALATATDTTSDLSVPLTVIMQPTAGVTDYFTGTPDAAD